MTIRVYSGRAGLQASAELWRALYAASETCNPFLAWEWFDVWAMRFADDASIRIAVAEVGGVPVGIAPLAYGRGRATSLVDNLFADYAEFVLAKGAGDGVVGSLVEDTLRHTKSVHVGPVRSVSPTAKALDAICAADPKHWLGQRICANPVVGTAGTFEDYLKSRTKKLRQELRTAVNHLNRSGGWGFEEAFGGEEFRHMYDALVEFHMRRQDRKLGKSIFEEGPNRAFFRDLPDILGVAPFRVQMSGITCQGRIISAAYSLLCGGTLFYWIPSFDQTSRIASLGKLHIQCLLERCFERGWSFDFMGGDEAYKLQWATSCYEVRQYQGYTSGLSCEFSRARLRVRDLARQAIQASPLLAKVRKSIQK